jgi:hypothetical protein
MASLTTIGTPSSGPILFPDARRASLDLAVSSAAGFMNTIAL